MPHYYCCVSKPEYLVDVYVHSSYLFAFCLLLSLFLIDFWFYIRISLARLVFFVLYCVSLYHFLAYCWFLKMPILDWAPVNKTRWGDWKCDISFSVLSLGYTDAVLQVKWEYVSFKIQTSPMCKMLLFHFHH